MICSVWPVPCPDISLVLTPTLFGQVFSVLWEFLFFSSHTCPFPTSDSQDPLGLDAETRPLAVRRTNYNTISSAARRKQYFRSCRPLSSSVCKLIVHYSRWDQHTSSSRPQGPQRRSDIKWKTTSATGAFRGRHKFQSGTQRIRTLTTATLLMRLFPSRAHISTR